MRVADPFALAIGERVGRRVGERERLVLEQVAERIPEELVVARRLDPFAELRHAVVEAFEPDPLVEVVRRDTAERDRSDDPERAQREARGLVEAGTDILAREHDLAVGGRDADRADRGRQVAEVGTGAVRAGTCRAAHRLRVDVTLVVEREAGGAQLVTDRREARPCEHRRSARLDIDRFDSGQAVQVDGDAVGRAQRRERVPRPGRTNATVRRAPACDAMSSCTAALAVGRPRSAPGDACTLPDQLDQSATCAAYGDPDPAGRHGGDASMIDTGVPAGMRRRRAEFASRRSSRPRWAGTGPIVREPRCARRNAPRLQGLVEARSTMVRARPTSEYLAELPDDRRTAIEAVRDVILEHLPRATKKSCSTG